MNGQSIFSARTGVIKNEGGPGKYTKSESSNTVWDSDKTARASQELDSKTKTIQEIFDKIKCENQQHFIINKFKKNGDIKNANPTRVQRAIIHECIRFEIKNNKKIK